MKRKKEKKQQPDILIIILIVICIIAFILAGVLIFNLMNRTEQNSPVNPEPTTTQEKTPEELVAEFQEEHKGHWERLNNTIAEANNIHDNDPDNIVAIAELYINATNETLAEGDLPYAVYYIQFIQELFKENNLPELELSSLLKINTGLLINEYEYVQYKVYARIVELSNQLGRTDLVSEYEPLATKYKAIYDKVNEAAEEDVRNYAKERSE